MTWFNWFRREDARARQPRRLQPALEPLEERAVPATLSADGLTITASAPEETITIRPISATRLEINGSAGGAIDDFTYQPTGREITIKGGADATIILDERAWPLERPIHVTDPVILLEYQGTSARTWQITGRGQGELGLVRFDGVSSVSTGSSDRFVFHPGGSLSKDLTVNRATDAVLDCFLRTDNVPVDLQSVGASAVGHTAVVRSAKGIHTVLGGAGNDILRGDAAVNELHGLGGHDLLSGRAGNDLLYGEGGQDVLMGDLGDDRLYGQGAPDLLVGGLGADFLDGGIRPDIVISGTTSFDAAPDRLTALLEAWFAREGLTKQQRTAALAAGIPFGFGKSIIKLDAPTVFNDTSVDGLMNSHGEDWLWMRYNSRFPFGGRVGTDVYDVLYLDPIEWHPPSL